MQQFPQEPQAANPQSYQPLQQKPQALLQLLTGGVRGMRAPGRPCSQDIQVRPEEKPPIDKVLDCVNC